MFHLLTGNESLSILLRIAASTELLLNAGYYAKRPYIIPKIKDNLDKEFLAVTTGSFKEKDAILLQCGKTILKHDKNEKNLPK